MKPIGGFFELELGAGGEPYHAAALALASGRACLRRLLERSRPSRVWTPFYVCDSVVQTIEKAGVELEYYALDASLDPVLPAGAPADGECLLYVNYFGIKLDTAASLDRTLGDRAILDDTHAFFQRGYPRAASFNSARKFFGVPDGAYAYGAGLDLEAPRAPAPVHYDHLVNRLLGHQRLAFEQYRESEACVTDEPVPMSALSERLLARVEYDRVRRTRRDNFLRLHERLGAHNRLALNLAAGLDAPYCYPLLADQPVEWERFWDRGLFTPMLWPEVPGRPAAGAFEWERTLAARLLPLPVDHRYGSDDVDRVVRTVDEVMGW